MAKVKNVATGIYADGEIFVQSQEVVEVPEAKAAYLCSPACPGSFERVQEAKAVKPAQPERGFKSQAKVKE